MEFLMKHLVPALAALICCLYSIPAQARALTLPPGLAVLCAQSFSGCGSVHEIIVPDSVSRIEDGAFDGCGEALLIRCGADSPALTYARANGLDYDADTQCRALVIGQSYTGTDHALSGTINDARAMNYCLAMQEGRPFAVTQKSDLTAAALISQAGSAFSGATDRDISLFYFSGHGDMQGGLICADGESVTPAALRSAMDEIPGRKLIVIDACYSGAWTEGELTPAANARPEDFAAAFLSGFQGRARSTDGYDILVSARSAEESAEQPITSGSLTKTMGCFTYALCMGCGWNGVTSRPADKAADTNGDGAVSIYEAYSYAKSLAASLNPGQTAQTNRENRAFAPFR